MHLRYGALITAAGASRRFGRGKKKEYYILDQKPVLVRSLEAFLNVGLFTSVVVTIPQGDREVVSALLAPHIDPARVRLVEGGHTRQASVLRGLEAMADRAPEWVLIHDGARPYVTPALIRRVLACTEEVGGAVPVLDVVNALVAVTDEGKIRENLVRQEIKVVQTPQGFIYSRIIAAHIRARDEGITAVDDSSLYRCAGWDVYTVPGNRENHKITFPEDLQ